MKLKIIKLYINILNKTIKIQAKGIKKKKVKHLD